MPRDEERCDDERIGHLERQFSRASIARRDFEEAEEYLLARDPTHPSAIASALLVAAVIAYARPFKNSDTSGMSSAKLPAGALRGLPPELRGLHDQLLALRDEAIAHSAFVRRAALRIEVQSAGGYVATAERRFDIRRHVTSPEHFLALVRSMHLFTNEEVFRLDALLRDASAS